MVLKGVVYDVTQYAARHPGGSVIYDAAGKDGTALYGKYWRDLSEVPPLG
jgi:cytochrome b involved in lipid metabolism